MCQMKYPPDGVHHTWHFRNFGPHASSTAIANIILRNERNISSDVDPADLIEIHKKDT